MTPTVLNQINHISLPVLNEIGEWHGRLVLTGESDNAEFEATAEMLSYFSRLASIGAFALTRQKVGVSHLGVSIARQQGALEAKISARHLHPGAWRVLLQLIGHCHQMEPYQDFSLQAIESSSFAQGKPVVQSDYPELFAHNDSLLRYASESALSDDLCIRLTSIRELSSVEVRSIGELIDDWGTVVYAGGFSDVGNTIDSPLLNKPNTYRVGQREVEIAVSEFTSHPHAWFSLINLSLALSSLYSLSSIEVE